MALVEVVGNVVVGGNVEVVAIVFAVVIGIRWPLFSFCEVTASFVKIMKQELKFAPITPAKLGSKKSYLSNKNWLSLETRGRSSCWDSANVRRNLGYEIFIVNLIKLRFFDVFNWMIVRRPRNKYLDIVAIQIISL